MKSAVRTSAALALVLFTSLVGLLSSATAAQANSAIPEPMYEFVPDQAGGRLWNAYNQTDAASGPRVVGQVSPLSDPADGLVHVFVMGGNGHLVQYVNDGKTKGQVWSTYDVTAVTGTGPLGGPPTAYYSSSPGAVTVVAPLASGDEERFVLPSGGSWQATDVTTATGVAVQVDGPSSMVVYGGVEHVYATATNGELAEFVDDHLGGRTWNVYDQSLATTSGPLAGAPQAVLMGSLVHVYVRAATGTLQEFVNDGIGGQPWNAYDLSAEASGGGAVAGRPSPVVVNGLVHVFVASSAGDLVEYVDDGGGGHVWNAYDHSLDAGGGRAVTGTPFPILAGSIAHIYVRSTGGDLLEFIADGVGGRVWNTYDQTRSSGGPQAVSDPAAVLWGGLVHVYAAGPPLPSVISGVVSTAEAQDQYAAQVAETPLGSNCNPFTGYWGRGSTAGCAPGTAAEEWCSDFAQWVWAQEGIDTTGITGWSYTFVNWGLAHGTFKYGAGDNPQPGDAVVWGDPSTSYGVHVAIVVGVSEGEIQVVSGNSGPPIDAQGDVAEVWESGWFNPVGDTIGGFGIVGYISPVAWSGIG